MNLAEATTISRFVIQEFQIWTSPAMGFWIFTGAFVATISLMAAIACQRKLIWKV